MKAPRPTEKKEWGITVGFRRVKWNFHISLELVADADMIFKKEWKMINTRDNWRLQRLLKMYGIDKKAGALMWGFRRLNELIRWVLNQMRVCARYYFYKHSWLMKARRPTANERDKKEWFFSRDWLGFFPDLQNGHLQSIARWWKLP